MTLDDILTLLKKEPDAPLDIAEIALLLAKEEYSELDVEAHLGEINSLAHEAKHYIRGAGEVQVKGLCRYLFHELGFRGNTSNYYDPDNSYFNMVMERRTGIPISLSVVAMSIGSRLGMNISGVGLPGHFIAKATVGGDEFLFDPFHGGRQLTEQDCEILVSQISGIQFQLQPEHLQAVPLGFIVQRMLNNLKVIYLGQEDYRRGIRIIERLRQLDPENLLHRRDLGACFLRNQQPGKALDHLRAYVEDSPNAQDKESVVKLIDDAKSELARWN